MASKLLSSFTLTCPRPSIVPSPTFSSLSSTFTRIHLIQFNAGGGGGRYSRLRRRLFLFSTKATSDQQSQEDGVIDSKILQYCSIDKKEKKSVGELEQDFLQALQAFYYEGKAIMSNEEFDNLKEELMWEGSSVVMLSSAEQKFLEASIAYVSGKPIMSDKEFDQLKMKLKMEGSEIVAEGPRCSLRSRKVYSDLTVDYLKALLLNVPATVLALGLFFFLDDITGFEVSYFIEIPEPFSFILTWFAAVPFILWFAQSITNAIIKDFLILKGPCPNCGTENTSFFGTILSISSGNSTNTVKCENAFTLIASAMVFTFMGEPTLAVVIFRPSKWALAHATFYGDETASETMGGACGYGNLFQNGYGTDTVALSSTLFNNGYACGACFQIKCYQSSACYRNVAFTTVTATNLCPPNWSKPSDNGGWCNPPRVHFDMAKPAFMKIAQWKAGIVPVMYRRVPCQRKGGVRFSFQGNGYWLLVYVMNVGGGGDISSMMVKGSRTGWIKMSHNWGASYQAFATLGGQALSFRITSYTTKETIIAWNVVPSNWNVGLTYSARTNFH